MHINNYFTKSFFLAYIVYFDMLTVLIVHFSIVQMSNVRFLL